MSRPITFLKALNEAMAEEMRRDPRVFVMGEDVRIGVFAQTRGLVEEFGPERVLNTPIAENALVGAAIGAAMNGMRPILELMFGDFLLMTMDQVCNNLAQWHYITGGQYPMPVVIRAAMGGGSRSAYGHSQCVESQLIQTPGLTVAIPSTPADAKGLLKTAIRSNNPVVFVEHKRLLLNPRREEMPEGDVTVPFGQAAVRRTGSDVTLFAVGYMVTKALAAAETLAAEGISAEVIDPRTIVPLDQATLFASVRKTGRLVTVEESRIRGGIGAEVAALVCGACFGALRAPVERVAAPMVPVPGGPILEDLYLPGEAEIVAAARRAVAWQGGGGAARPGTPASERAAP